ncbi:hypothetical protein TI05_06330, partial [Achromatium sp. WMS3]
MYKLQFKQIFLGLGILFLVGNFGIAPANAASWNWPYSFSWFNGARSKSGERKPPPLTFTQERTKFQQERKMAVVAGISAYPAETGFYPLNFARKDAEALAAVLKQRGYLVQLLTDAEVTKGAILKAIDNVGHILDRNQGTVIFAFSGHGFRDRAGNNYLAPYEAYTRNNKRVGGLTVHSVEEALINSGARRRILLIDACRDVPDSGSDFRIKSGTRKRQDSFAQHKLFQQATGTRILFSTKAGGVSWEHPELQHSVFTYF